MFKHPSSVVVSFHSAPLTLRPNKERPAENCCCFLNASDMGVDTVSPVGQVPLKHPNRVFYFSGTAGVLGTTSDLGFFTGKRGHLSLLNGARTFTFSLSGHTPDHRNDSWRRSRSDGGFLLTFRQTPGLTLPTKGLDKEGEISFIKMRKETL